MAYSYYFKNTHYFRKMIHHKYIKDRTSYLNYRRSLKLCVDEDFYYYLENNKEELDKILDFINKKVTRFLKENEGENKLTVAEINQYINNVTEEYRKRAVIENSILEDNRLKSIETIDEAGKIQRGFQLQALTVKFKQLDDLYKNLEEPDYKDKIRESAIEIVKRSDMSLEDVMKQVSVEYLQKFYEMTVKSEREVLKNDLKIYIKRNLEQFFPLIPSHITDEAVKVEEAHYQYTILISSNPVQKNYLKFIRDNAVRTQGVSVDNKTQEQMMSDIINALQEQEKERALATSLEIDSLIERYMDFRDSSDTVRKRQNLSLTFFRDFVKGNGTSEHSAVKIEELTEDDVKRFSKVFSNATPKSTKETRDMTLFELADYRVKNGLNRYKDNTLEMMQFDIQNFWKYICKYIDNNLNPSLFDAFDVLYYTSQAKHKDKKADVKLRGFTQEELQTFVDVVYAEDKVKKILLDSPRNFYCFFFAYMLGTRIAEFTYIRTKDVKKQVKNGETAYYVYLNEDVEPQSLKNANAHRNLPIPQVLIDLGFLNYLNHRIKREKEWLWDFPNSGYGAISVFFQRHIKNNFPEEKEELQLRSLRKNFASKVFSDEYNLEEIEIESLKTLEQNIKRIMGHSEGSATGLYLDRIEPIAGKKLLDSLGDYDLDLERLKNDVKNHYKAILTDLDNVDSSFNWKKKSTVKPKKGRRV